MGEHCDVTGPRLMTLAGIARELSDMLGYPGHVRGFSRVFRNFGRLEQSRLTIQTAAAQSIFKLMQSKELNNEHY